MMKSLKTTITNVCSIVIAIIIMYASTIAVIVEGYTYYPNLEIWMKLYAKPGAHWSEARLHCFREGSTLASPLDQPMLDSMKELMGDHTPAVFTGISETYAHGYFYSIEGVPLENIPASFTNSEPDFSGTYDHCIGMNSRGTLEVLRCDATRPFICYVKDEDLPEKQPICGFDPDYAFESRTGQCYKFHTEGGPWSDAFRACATEGGHLAVINSETEAKALVDFVEHYPSSSISSMYPNSILLGFRDWIEVKTWMTIHGEPLKKAGYDKWAPGKPNHHDNDKNCGAMNWSGELIDIFCSTRLPFICEKKPNNETSTKPSNERRENTGMTIDNDDTTDKTTDAGHTTDSTIDAGRTIKQTTNSSHTIENTTESGNTTFKMRANNRFHLFRASGIY